MDQFSSQFSSQGQFNGEVNYTPTIDLTAMNGTPPDVTVNVEQQDAQSGEAASMAATGGKKKGTASRSKNFAQDEDEALCSAYLNVSKDAAVGVNQTYKSYWTRISDYYNEVSRNPTVRSLSSLQHRWGDIQKDTARFCGFYSEIVRRNQSGQSEDDKVKDALQMYAGIAGSPFKLIHCWLILHHSAKWNDWLAKEWNKGTKDKASVQDVTQDSPGASGQEGTGGSNVPTRPIGRDKAKRLRTSPAGSSSSSSAYIDVLQKIHEDRSKYDARVEAATIEEAQAIATRAERKLALQEKHVSIQGKQLEIATELLNLQKEDREDKVMSLDVEKMSPWVRDYYIRKQKEIAARAASRAGSSDLS